MRIKRYLMAVAAGLVLAGCQTEPADSGDAGPSARTEYLTTVQNEMKTVDAKIDDLTVKSQGMTSDAKVQANQTLAALREERAVLGEKYDQLMKASQDAWDSAKSSFGAAWDQLQAGLNGAMAKFN